MEMPLPPPVRPVIEAYLQAIKNLRSHFYGIYLYGSIALDAFEEGESDIGEIIQQELICSIWLPLPLFNCDTISFKTVPMEDSAEGNLSWLWPDSQFTRKSYPPE